MIAGRWVPGDVVVRVPCYTISRGEHFRMQYLFLYKQVSKTRHVLIFCALVVKDPRYFERPDEFIPHRWNSKGYMVKDAAAYFPFSIGKDLDANTAPHKMVRMTTTETPPPLIGAYDCVGKQLALMEVREAVARLVTSFDMELVDPRDVEWEYRGIDTFTLALPPLLVNFRAR